MTTKQPDAPPYPYAVLTTVLVLLGYLVSLAPTVTFWDAGEFIASSKILGIPHPPGTPLFVILGHVWGILVPIGEYAFRLNLMSAFFSALAAGGFFLVIWESLQAVQAGEGDTRGRMVRIGGAMAAALIGAFTFTNWQNSNETEVYGVATCMAEHPVATAARIRPGAADAVADAVYRGTLQRQPSPDAPCRSRCRVFHDRHAST
jgi:Protein of unknown function (DUF2723)